MPSQMKGLNKKPNALKPDQDYKVPVDGPEITKLDRPRSGRSARAIVARGQMNIARCYMCHQVNGTGVDFGPALDQWGLGRSPEAIATAIIHPNDGIAHGFEATEDRHQKRAHHPGLLPVRRWLPHPQGDGGWRGLDSAGAISRVSRSSTAP